jgi:predicted transcriptional regulator
MTKGEVLRYAIAFALRRSRKIVRGLKEGLTEGERGAVADHAVAQLKERGDPWRLNDEAPTAKSRVDLLSLVSRAREAAG